MPPTAAPATVHAVRRGATLHVATATNKEVDIRRDACRIGIDAGTGEVRVVALRSSDGRRLAEAVAPFAIDPDGERRLVDFGAIGGAMDAALDEVVGALPVAARVERIGVAATASTVAVVTHTGRPLAAGRLWSDHRATRQAAALRDVGHPNLDRMLGHVSPEWGIAKLAAMAGDGELDQVGADLVVELADWLAHRLTGTWTANAGTREWGWAGGDSGHPPRELLRAAGVDPGYADRVISDVRVTGATVADVAGPAASRHPRLRDALVIVGGMDSYLGALGCGVAREGRMCLSVGSSSAVLVGVAAGRADGRLFGPLRTILPGDPGGYWHGGQTTAGLAAQWAATVLGASRGRLERDAAGSPPGARGVVFLETLLDRRTPRPAAPLSGAWIGLRLDHSRGDLYRAVLEGVALGLADVCAGLRPAEIVATGGLLKSAVFRQALADVLEQPVALLRVAVSAPALGAAFADEPTRIADFVAPEPPVEPSGADYRDVRARRMAAVALGESDGGAGG